MDRPPKDDAEVTRLQEQIKQLTTAVQALTVVVQPQEASENEVMEWEKGFKFEFPEFHGGQSPEELLDWISTVEEILEYKRVPLELCVPMIATRFRGEGAAWWTQLKKSRARLDKPKILSWDKLKKKIRKTFLPLDYDQVMFKSLQNLQQGKRSVEEYSTEFFSLLRRVDLHESEQQIVARFIDRRLAATKPTRSYLVKPTQCC